MSRYRDKSIRHRPKCPECGEPMGPVRRTARKLVDADTSLVNRQFECVACSKTARMQTRVVETVVQASNAQ